MSKRKAEDEGKRPEVPPKWPKVPFYTLKSEDFEGTLVAYGHDREHLCEIVGEKLGSTWAFGGDDQGLIRVLLSMNESRRKSESLLGVHDGRLLSAFAVNDMIFDAPNEEDDDYKPKGCAGIAEDDRYRVWIQAGRLDDVDDDSIARYLAEAFLWYAIPEGFEEDFVCLAFEEERGLRPTPEKEGLRPTPEKEGLRPTPENKHSGRPLLDLFADMKLHEEDSSVLYELDRVCCFVQIH
jgi:hypothetical protein